MAPAACLLACGLAGDVGNLRGSQSWGWTMHAMAKAIFYEQGKCHVALNRGSELLCGPEGCECMQCSILASQVEL